MSQAPHEIEIPAGFPCSIDVSGRTVVITGATRGLGRLLSIAFARSGATVGLVARDDGQLVKAAADLPGQHATFAGDIRDEQFNREVAQAMRADFGRLDVWIGNAGVSPIVRSLSNLNADSWQEVLDTNLTGSLFGAKAAAEMMEPGGRIILTSSVIGQRPMSGLGAYSVSKGALDALVRTLAVEMGSRGITVNAVAPGWFDSPLAAGFRETPDLDRRIVEHIPLGRWGQAADLPGIFLFLASAASSYMTGTIIPLDGGYLLK
jgi:NAD(P)-dependent dehydrogenase (short-subunit alcohol dehydrogenase family)